MLNGYPSREKVLVTGANGWFGRTALNLLAGLDVDVYATSQRPKQLVVGENTFSLQSWNLTSIQEFQPTTVIDCAFLTKELYRSETHDEYVRTNHRIVENACLLAALPSVNRFIGFSSGASITERNHPYGQIKHEYELQLQSLASVTPGLAVIIARAWSVSGHLVTKPEMFAFSDFISQARSGVINIKAKGLVSRRYVDVEDLIKLSMCLSNEPEFQILDSGGELVELGELARIVAEVVNPETKIIRHLDPATANNDYFSDGVSWNAACDRLQFKAQSLVEQIQRVSETIGPNR